MLYGAKEKFIIRNTDNSFSKAVTLELIAKHLNFDNWGWTPQNLKIENAELVVDETYEMTEENEYVTAEWLYGCIIHEEWMSNVIIKPMLRSIEKRA